MPIDWTTCRDLMTEEDEFVCPTEADLDRYEEQVGYRLPRSFREYALTFGSGEVWVDPKGGTFHFWMPPFDRNPDGLGGEAPVGKPTKYEGYPSPRLKSFVGDINNGNWFWDIDAVTDAIGPDYALVFTDEDGYTSPGLRLRFLAIG